MSSVFVKTFLSHRILKQEKSSVERDICPIAQLELLRLTLVS